MIRLGVAETVMIYSVGAVFLALWFDSRWPAASLRGAFLHAVAALLLLQLVSPLLHALRPDPEGSGRLAGVLFFVILPAFAYAFFGCCRLLRALSAARTFR